MLENWKNYIKEAWKKILASTECDSAPLHGDGGIKYIRQFRDSLFNSYLRNTDILPAMQIYHKLIRLSNKSARRQNLSIHQNKGRREVTICFHQIFIHMIHRLVYFKNIYHHFFASALKFENFFWVSKFLIILRYAFKTIRWTQHYKTPEFFHPYRANRGSIMQVSFSKSVKIYTFGGYFYLLVYM